MLTAMPSTSKKQHNFMEAVAHSPSFAKKVGVPQSVGKDFSAADKGRKFSKGGDMATKMNPGFMAMMAKKKATQEGSKADKAADKKQMMGMKKGGKVKETMGPRSMKSDVEKGSNTKRAHGEHGIQKKGHTKAMMPKMKGRTV
jgi:hypothetical protein